MASLTAIFGNSTDKLEDSSGKLQNLFWNRAELKKELSRLRDEQHRLLDCIKRQEGSKARMQQQLDHLEDLLLDPRAVYSTVTFYQFRSLNFQCKSRLAGFAEQLKQQREQRLHDNLMIDWDAQRVEEGRIAERKISKQREQVQMLEDKLREEQSKLASMNGFLKIFRRRNVEANLDVLADSIIRAQRRERDLMLEFGGIQTRTPPTTKGLDIATKRQINFMILSYAQHLYLHYLDNDLAARSKEAGDKGIGTIDYGGKDECDSLVELIKDRKESYESLKGFTEDLQQRAKLIAEKALFGSDNDAVPVSASVATVFKFGLGGVVIRKEANLLGENYWDLAKVLAR